MSFYFVFHFKYKMMTVYIYVQFNTKRSIPPKLLKYKHNFICMKSRPCITYICTYIFVTVAVSVLNNKNIYTIKELHPKETIQHFIDRFILSSNIHSICQILIQFNLKFLRKSSKNGKFQTKVAS